MWGWYSHIPDKGRVECVYFLFIWGMNYSLKMWLWGALHVPVQKQCRNQLHVSLETVAQWILWMLPEREIQFPEWYGLISTLQACPVAASLQKLRWKWAAVLLLLQETVSPSDQHVTVHITLFHVALLSSTAKSWPKFMVLLRDVSLLLSCLQHFYLWAGCVWC